MTAPTPKPDIAPNHFRLLVCGGRDFADRDRLYAVLDRVGNRRGRLIVIHGGAPGADTLAEQWAMERGQFTQAFPADWETHGRAAGPIRNQQMLDEGKPDAVVAFPGGRGTADMMRRARAARLTVLDLRSEARLARVAIGCGATWTEALR